MAKGLDRLQVSAESVADLKTRTGGLRSPTAAAGEPPPTTEEIARAFLRQVIGQEPRSAFRSLDPEEIAAEDAPRFSKRRERRERLTETDLVSFEQTKNGIPVFGSRAVVEVDDQRELVSASLDVADLEAVDTTPKVAAAEAAVTLGEFLGLDDAVPLPEPTITVLPHPHEEGALHLVWRFHAVAFEPPPGEQPAPDREESYGVGGRGGCAGHNVFLEPSFDYFVDAHEGKVIYLFSNSAHIEVPTRCYGEDEEGQTQRFYGRVGSGGFEMDNPFEDILTIDLQLQAIETTPLPGNGIQNGTNDWGSTNRAAVSAHVNATRVLDFLFRILRRNSIDDHGMELKNIVNCFSNQSATAADPEWINAVWWNGAMWYGQEDNGAGGFTSLSRHLDIIAHELFHGVTENTADLVYEGLPGALNESFSDIFGVIIRNWHLAPDSSDPSTWDWQIGAGLGSGGAPLRDMAAPGSVGTWWRPATSPLGYEILSGYPDHMDQYVTLPITSSYDWGGVHWYSNIHNLAAHNVLTAQRADGSFIFTPEEAAVLYYLVLTRLSQLSDFDDTRAELLSVAGTVYAGDAARASEATGAIGNAYDAVGIV